jgi:uncharacterized protein (DUF1800 family)
MPMPADDVAHLLRRAGFGGSPTEVQSLAALDLSAVVDHVLATSANPPSVVPAIFGDASSSDYERFMALTHDWMDRMATVPAPIQEKMALFWHGHFTSALDKLYDANAFQQQLWLYRSLATGDFRALTHAMALQPAMLLYLDNGDNVAGSPNENFARELMELFLLGIGHYTEADVAASARAWTGYGLNADSSAYEYHPNEHDAGAKTFMGKTANWTGPMIIDELFDNATTRSVLASYITTKVWNFFAGPGTITPAVSSALASTFISSNFDIASVLRAIFLRPEFYGADVKSGLVRSPVEYAVAILRGTGLSASQANPEWYIDKMGQELFNPPNVSGWKQNGYWISTSAAAAKADFVDYVGWRGNELNSFVDPAGLTADQAVQAAFDRFQIISPSAATRSALVSWLQRQRAALYEGWAERRTLSVLVMLSPDIQLA